MKRITKPAILLFIFLLGCSPLTTPVQDTSPLRTDPPTRVPALPTTTLTSAATATGTFTPLPSSTHAPSSTPQASFSFALTSDMTAHTGPGEYDTPQYFRGACESIARLGGTDFMISVGDVSLASDTHWTVQQVLGADYLWYPIVGNHDLYAWDMNFIRGYYADPDGNAHLNIVNTGPPDCEETTLSFDHHNAHFVLLNVYCDTSSDIRTDGAIVDALYYWLREDLEATDKEHIFVLGHEPAYIHPDADTGLMRHLGESLDKYPITRDRFWNLLKEFGVTAYITGHTHAFSVVDIDGVWQINTGHAMGARTQATPSTYVVIYVFGGRVFHNTYRTDRDGAYVLKHSGVLK